MKNILNVEYEKPDRMEAGNHTREPGLGGMGQHAAVLAQLVEHLRNNPAHFFTRDDLAEKADMSPAHFSRACKSVLGLSPRQLMAGVKKNHACNLLRRPQLSVKQVSVECGFDSQNHFSAWFKNQTGQSPSAFRKSVSELMNQ